MDVSTATALLPRQGTSGDKGAWICRQAGTDGSDEKRKSPRRALRAFTLTESVESLPLVGGFALLLEAVDAFLVIERIVHDPPHALDALEDFRRHRMGG